MNYQNKFFAPLLSLLIGFTTQAVSPQNVSNDQYLCQITNTNIMNVGIILNDSLYNELKALNEQIAKKPEDTPKTIAGAWPSLKNNIAQVIRNLEQSQKETMLNLLTHIKDLYAISFEDFILLRENLSQKENHQLIVDAMKSLKIEPSSKDILSLPGKLRQLKNIELKNSLTNRAKNFSCDHVYLIYIALLAHNPIANRQEQNQLQLFYVNLLIYFANFINTSILGHNEDNSLSKEKLKQIYQASMLIRQTAIELLEAIER